MEAGAVGGAATPLAPSVPSAPPSQEEAPPPYSTLSNPATDAPPPVCWPSPAVTPQGAFIPKGVKLGYVDFVPRVVRKRVFKGDDYETFDVLVQRANNWLEDYDGIDVVSCETVTWMGMRTKDIYSDMSAFEKSMLAGRTTKLIRGLRLWYFVETVPSPARRSSRPILHSHTYVPRKNERFDQLLARVNEVLNKDRMGGRLMCTETLRVMHPHGSEYRPALVNPKQCYWKEMPTSRKTVVLCLRVYILINQQQEETESIGYQDFVPEHNQRNKENKGYEVLSDVMERANRWVARQQGVRFTNLQTISIKLKKKRPFEERCVFTEHRSANGRMDLNGPNKNTHYLGVVRAYFVVSKSAGPLPPPIRLTYKTFAPAQISPVTNDGPPEYEEIKTLMDRINQWLQITGARVFCIETAVIRTSTGQLMMLGPEATYSRNGLPCPSREKWIHFIRLYLDGDYVEPPSAVGLVIPGCTVVTRSYH